MTKDEVIEILESVDKKRMVQIGNDDGGYVVTAEFALIVIDKLMDQFENISVKL